MFGPVSPAQAESAVPVLTTDILVVLGVVVLALVLFLTERLPIDVTAIVLVVRSDREAIASLGTVAGLEPAGHPSPMQFPGDEEGIITELVVSLDSSIVGERLDPEKFRAEFDAAVLGLRSRGELVAERIVGTRLSVGDTLLVEASPETLDASRVQGT